jgi:glucoamylase
MRYPSRYLAAALLAATLGACSNAVPQPAPTSRPVAIATAAPTAPPPTAPPAAPPPTTTLPQQGAAPGAPIASDTWTPGNKQGFGTAFTYDGPAGAGNPSRVWFTITGGAITDGLYPDVSQANLKSLGVVVAGPGFLADETTGATVTIARLDGRAPAYRVTSTDTQGRWAVVKEVVADPQANTILLTMAFQALQGRPGDYRMFLNYIPRLGQSGAGDLSMAGDGIAEAWDDAAGVATALASDPPPALVTTGYTGQSDILSDLADGMVDATWGATTQPGRISIGMELPTSGASTVALGFGPRREEARAAARASLDRGFAAVAAAYMRGWAGYLDAMPPPYPKLPLYEESLGVLKSLEDKTSYGAFVAAPAIPWGQFATDEDPKARGERYVWPRDLYHIAMALRVAGDEQAARDALAFMDDRMQLASGAFPRRTLPDGTAEAGDIQMDQVAAPILLAWQLKASDRYASLVKPAADFIAANGPTTTQDRWDEAGGYTPATLAAEIAGLVCAADLARQAGDDAGATRYLQRADEWNANVEKWTLTTSGPLGADGYFLRVTGGDPNTARAVALAGGPAVDQREIVDQSFLELVRLGLRRPDDPHILASLEVTDETLEAKTPKGELYYRYSHDANGESAPGLAPDGHGSPWPLLIGEHSIYEVAKSRSEHPASWYLPVISDLANTGGMLPEQVFLDGSGTGAATPHGWAHAEYVMFAHAVKQERVPDMPAVVAERYLR